MIGWRALKQGYVILPNYMKKLILADYHSFTKQSFMSETQKDKPWGRLLPIGLSELDFVTIHEYFVSHHTRGATSCDSEGIGNVCIIYSLSWDYVHVRPYDDAQGFSLNTSRNATLTCWWGDIMLGSLITILSPFPSKASLTETRKSNRLMIIWEPLPQTCRTKIDTRNTTKRWLTYLLWHSLLQGSYPNLHSLIKTWLFCCCNSKTPDPFDPVVLFEKQFSFNPYRRSKFRQSLIQETWISS